MTDGISIADLCRSTSRVLDTRAPSRQWNGHASIDLRRAASEIERLEAALRIIAGEAPSPDNLLGNADIARLALYRGHPHDR